MKIKIFALVYGLLTHLTFLVAITMMFISIYYGLNYNLYDFNLSLPFQILINLLLIIQFPLIHSFLLNPRYTYFMDKIISFEDRKKLRTTTYSLLASLQLILVFSFWQSTGIPLFTLPQYLIIPFDVIYLLSWIFLATAIQNSGIGLQTGFIGWWALFTNQNPKYPDMPSRGLFKYVRQPIYLGFFLVLLTPPSFSLDRILLLIFWGIYCVHAPRMKEARFEKIYGDRFRRYQNEVPYFIPSFLKFK